eukprot:scaffold113216_cov48-Prasinocladus_malaysianus.AAC.1
MEAPLVGVNYALLRDDQLLERFAAGKDLETFVFVKPHPHQLELDNGGGHQGQSRPELQVGWDQIVTDTHQLVQLGAQRQVFQIGGSAQWLVQLLLACEAAIAAKRERLEFRQQGSRRCQGGPWVVGADL